MQICPNQRHRQYCPHHHDCVQRYNKIWACIEVCFSALQWITDFPFKAFSHDNVATDDGDCDNCTDLLRLMIMMMMTALEYTEQKWWNDGDVAQIKGTLHRSKDYWWWLLLVARIPWWFDDFMVMMTKLKYTEENISANYDGDVARKPRWWQLHWIFQMIWRVRLYQL